MMAKGATIIGSESGRQSGERSKKPLNHDLPVVSSGEGDKQVAPDTTDRALTAPSVKGRVPVKAFLFDLWAQLLR